MARGNTTHQRRSRRTRAWARSGAGVRSGVTGEVARRELSVLTRTRTWRVTTVLLVIATAVGMVLLMVFRDDGGEPRSVRVGHTEPVAALQEALEGATASPLSVSWVSMEAADTQADLQRADVDVVVELPGTLVWDDSVDDEIATVLARVLTDVAMQQRAGDLGLSNAELDALLAPVEIRHEFTGEPEDDGTSASTLGIALSLTMLTFIGLQVYGSIVIISVIKEKADHVVEILLAHVRARELLLGKVAGVTAVAAAQVAAVLLTAAVALTFTGGLELPISPWLIALLALVIFLLGFGFYAVVLAVAGSLVSRIEDGQFVALPVTIPLVVSYVIGLALVIEHPGHAASRVLSYVPLSSPVIMPIRVVAGSAAAWEVALAVMLLLGAAWWTVVLAGRVYESTVLRAGTRTSWREALSLARRDPPH